jgi:hypothetical protein
MSGLLLFFLWVILGLFSLMLLNNWSSVHALGIHSPLGLSTVPSYKLFLKC